MAEPTGEWTDTERELADAVREANKAAHGDGNWGEISALWFALDLALGRWPEVTAYIEDMT